jgi:hypothetical protein
MSKDAADPTPISPREQPAVAPAARDARAEREARLAEALRANLRRRKTQDRARATDAKTDDA